MDDTLSDRMHRVFRILAISLFFPLAAAAWPLAILLAVKYFGG